MEIKKLKIICYIILINLKLLNQSQKVLDMIRRFFVGFFRRLDVSYRDFSFGKHKSPKILSSQREQTHKLVKAGSCDKFMGIAAGNRTIDIATGKYRISSDTSKGFHERNCSDK